MARRSDHSREEIREMVLRATESIVSEQGYAGLTVRKVAMRIGYTVGSIYLVFKNLDDLILHVNARTLEELSRKLDESMSAQRSPMDNINALGRAYLRYASERFYRWSMIFEHRFPDTDAVPEWYLERVLELIKKVEIQCAGLASHRSEAEIRLAARTLWSGVHGVCILALTGKLAVVGSEDVERSVDSLVTNYLQGWLGLNR
ncbi:MAG: TetR/AcrR family transcriptional regulator [Pseudomonadota bacterium]